MTTPQDNSVIFSRMAVIGVGLIGSSIALAARATGAVETVTLCDLDPDVRAEAARLELGDVKETVEAACRDADLVVLAVPVGSIGAAARACAPVMKSGAVLSDVGSVKGAAAKGMAEAAPEGVFVVPGHPIAGTEHSGPGAWVCGTVPRPLVHHHATGGRPRRVWGRGRSIKSVLGAPWVDRRVDGHPPA